MTHSFLMSSCCLQSLTIYLLSLQYLGVKLLTAPAVISVSTHEAHSINPRTQPWCNYGATWSPLLPTVSCTPLHTLSKSASRFRVPPNSPTTWHPLTIHLHRCTGLLQTPWKLQIRGREGRSEGRPAKTKLLRWECKIRWVLQSESVSKGRYYRILMKKSTELQTRSFAPDSIPISRV